MEKPESAHILELRGPNLDLTHICPLPHEPRLCVLHSAGAEYSVPRTEGGIFASECRGWSEVSQGGRRSRVLVHQVFTSRHIQFLYVRIPHASDASNVSRQSGRSNPSLKNLDTLYTLQTFGVTTARCWFRSAYNLALEQLQVLPWKAFQARCTFSLPFCTALQDLQKQTPGKPALSSTRPGTCCGKSHA